MLLEKFEQFVEGGARITLESGRYCTRDETSIKVWFMDDKDADEKIFYFDNENSVLQCKTEMCQHFDVDP